MAVIAQSGNVHDLMVLNDGWFSIHLLQILSPESLGNSMIGSV